MFLFNLKPLASDKRISEFTSKLNDYNQLFLLPHTTAGTVL